MKEKLILLFTSVVGLGSIFLPWVEYPKANMTAYGYMGDGLLTGLVFLSFIVLSFFIKRYERNVSIYALIAGFLIFLLGFYNLSEIRDQQVNFKSDNIGITMASAGFHEGIGMYLHMLSGLGLFIFGLYMVISKKQQANSIDNSSGSFGKSAVFTLIFGLIIGVGTIIYFKPTGLNLNPSSVPEDLETIIENDINEMVNALQNNDFNTYNKYVHPVLAQSMGGEKMLKDFFEGTYKTFSEDKISIKTIKVDKLLDVKTRAEDKQALFIQKVTFSQNGREFDESQKTLAINDNRSKQWKYITIGNNKKIAEIKKMFPAINEELNNLEN